MNQPELGKKIAELRKAKGLTQEELVGKCNINVRTLQRIESGEVTPRSYTVKIIFAALDYNIFDSSKNLTNRLINIELIVSERLGQLYKYVIDLFNLKTNTMRKIIILSVPFLTISMFLLFSYTSKVKAQNRMVIKDKFEKMISGDDFVRQFNSGQIDSIGMNYLENACMMPDQYKTINGRKNINEYYWQLYNRGLRFSQAKSVSNVISDSIAVDRGIWKVRVDSVVIATGTYLSQWHYINGKWMIENEMSKSDVAIKKD